MRIQDAYGDLRERLPDHFADMAEKVLRELDARAFAAHDDPVALVAAREFAVEDACRWLGRDLPDATCTIVLALLCAGPDPVLVLEYDVGEGADVRRIDGEALRALRRKRPDVESVTRLVWRAPAEAWREPVVSAEVQRWTHDVRLPADDCGLSVISSQDVHGEVWLTTESGRVYAAPQSPTMTLEEVRDRYLAQGHTDEGCTLHAAPEVEAPSP